MKNRMSKLVFLMVGAGLASFAHAEFKEDVPSNVMVGGIVAPVNNGKNEVFRSDFNNIVETGVMPSNILPLKGNPKSASVLSVLKEITPYGWKVKQSGKINLKGNASWNHGETWVGALDRIAGNSNLSVDLNWDKKTYTLKPSVAKKSKHSDYVLMKDVKPASSPVKMVKPVKESMPVVIVQENLSPVIPEMKKLVASTCSNCSVENKAWTLLPELSLRANMEEWSTAAGWKLIWNAVDYPVDVMTNLTGDFAADDGPIKQLSIAYRDAKRPLVFNFREGNKTLLVINYEFEQTLIKDHNLEAK